MTGLCRTQDPELTDMREKSKQILLLLVGVSLAVGLQSCVDSMVDTVVPGPLSPTGMLLEFFFAKYNEIPLPVLSGEE